MNFKSAKFHFSPWLHVQAQYLYSSIMYMCVYACMSMHAQTYIFWLHGVDLVKKKTWLRNDHCLLSPFIQQYENFTQRKVAMRREQNKQYNIFSKRGRVATWPFPTKQIEKMSSDGRNLQQSVIYIREVTVINWMQMNKKSTGYSPF